MSIMISNNAKIHENYNLNGQKEYFLLIDCKSCKESKNDFFTTQKCIQCLFLNIYCNRNKKFKEVLINSKNLNFRHDQFNQLLLYYKKLKLIKKNYKKIEHFKESKCPYKEFNCKIFHGIKKLKETQYLDPLFFYNKLITTYELIKKKQVFDNNCINCVGIVIHRLDFISKLFFDCGIVKLHDRIINKNLKIEKTQLSYKQLFLNNGLIQETILNNNDQNLSMSGKLIKIYKLSNPPLYQISIFEEFDEYEKKYEIELFLNSKSEENFFRTIIEDIIKNLEVIKFNKIVTLTNLITVYKEAAKNFLDRKYIKLNNEEKERLAYLTSLKKLNLEKLFPLLIDDYVEEIFLDSPNDIIYLNHQEFGRCRTTLKLNMVELERIKTFLRIYSGQRLDYSSPSLKFVIKNALFYCRFAIDVDPLQIEKFGLDIRKLNKNILSIQDLLKNRTLNPEIAAFLYFCIIKRINITVTGETDTGKTTLINALDLITPKDFRKIYIENTVESLNQRKFGKHQLKYLVDSNEQNDKNFSLFSKSNQIKTLLHRSPDLIYLGEILTKEEAKAMFHCLASGLRGFQTIHSKSVSSLLNRFIYFFDIEPSCLNDLGIIVFMRKINYKRLLISISEIFIKNQNQNKKINKIYNFIPESNNWIQECSLYNTRLLENIRNFENISELLFKEYLSIYNDIFTWLYDFEKLDNDQLVSFFHKISFLSIMSINKLKDYWLNWKKSHQ